MLLAYEATSPNYSEGWVQSIFPVAAGIVSINNFQSLCTARGNALLTQKVTQGATSAARKSAVPGTRDQRLMNRGPKDDISIYILDPSPKTRCIPKTMVCRIAGLILILFSGGSGTCFWAWDAAETWVVYA